MLSPSLSHAFQDTPFCVLCGAGRRGCREEEQDTRRKGRGEMRKDWEGETVKDERKDEGGGRKRE